MGKHYNPYKSMFDCDQRADADVVDVEVERVIHATTGATLYRIDGEDVWIPNSVHSPGSDDDVISVARWFAEREGLI